jgi:MYXO-CTERM domain-containing protein
VSILINLPEPSQFLLAAAALATLALLRRRTQADGRD